MRLSRAPRLPDPVRPEMELLVCCAMSEMAVAVPRIEALLEQEIDWTSLVRLALAHGMTPLLARGLERVSAGVPEEIADALRIHLEDNRARNRALAAVLVDLLDALRERGVEAIPFKGPVLGAVAYGDFSLRRAGDLDILVRPGDVTSVCEWLSGAGFRELSEIRTGRPLSPAEDAAHRRSQCEYAFVRESDRVVVEPHWAIAPAAFGPTPDHAALWTRARTERCLDRPVPSLAPEDLLALLSIHGAKHEWAELRWIADVAGLIARHPGIDLDAALAEGRACGCARMLLVALGLSRRLLGTELPRAIARHVGEDGTAGALVEGVSHRLLSGARAMDTFGRVSPFLVRVRERRRDRLRYVARTLTTPRLEHMRLVPLPESLHGLYVPVALAHDHLLVPLLRATKRVRDLGGRASTR